MNDTKEAVTEDLFYPALIIGNYSLVIQAFKISNYRVSEVGDKSSLHEYIRRVQGSCSSSLKVLGLRDISSYQVLTPLLKFIENISFDFVVLSDNDNLPEPLVSRFRTVEKKQKTTNVEENDIQLFLRKVKNEEGFISSAIFHKRDSMNEAMKVDQSHLPYRKKVMELLDNGS